MTTVKWLACIDIGLISEQYEQNPDPNAHTAIARELESKYRPLITALRNSGLDDSWTVAETMRVQIDRM